MNTKKIAPGTAAAPAAPTKKMEHPLLAQARAFAAEGKSKAAGSTLEKLAAMVPPFEKAQLLAMASQFVRVDDKKRAKELAEQATVTDPDCAQAWVALSNICDDEQDRVSARKFALRALEAKANPKELVEIGRNLSRLGADRKALEAVRRGYEASGEKIELASYTLRVAKQCADWALAEGITARLQAGHDAGRTKEIGETPRTHLLWCADEATNMKTIAAFAEKSFPVREPMVTKAWPDGDKRKIRIGYLSSDYRDHATSLLALGMMRHHDHDRFEFFAYCTSYDDGSALRREMLTRFDHARTFSKVNDRVAAMHIVKDKIDILVDLNGLTEGTRHGVMAYHPAPVQISYLGFPGTVGGRFVEYIIGDDYTVPEGVEKLFPEKIIRIPPTYQINDYHARYLPPKPSRKKYKLPEGVPILGMFNNVNKLGTEVWDTWMQIMLQAPQAVLWQLDPGEVGREYLQAAAVRAGVSQERIIFASKASQEAHLARIQLCDLVLDPWPYGGHTTTSDAIFAGVPAIALEGTNFASRVSGGLLKAAGLGMLVQPTKDAYVKLAVTLLNKPGEIAKMKHFITGMKNRLGAFDAPMRTRQLETAYLEAYKLSAKGLRPRHIRVLPTPPAVPKAESPTEQERKQ